MNEYPTPTLTQINEFWDLFTAKHPNIAKHITGTAFSDRIGVFWDKDIDEGSERIFDRFLNRWMSDNGFADKQMDEIYLSLNDGANNGVRAMDTATIISVKGIDDKLTAIEFKEDDMDKPVTIFVKGFVEDLRKEIYIF